MSITETQTEIHWTPLLEKYFSDTGEKALCYSWMHKQSEQIYSYRSTFIDLPVIILATLNGAVSVGSKSLFGENDYASVGIGVVALFTAVLNTVGSYFGWARRAEAHKISSLQYGKLYRYIKVEMGLPREERAAPRDFLKSVKEQYDRLAEVSPLVPFLIIKQFKHKFNEKIYEEIARPEEADGLTEIIVYTKNKDTEYVKQEVQVEEIVQHNSCINVPKETRVEVKDWPIKKLGLFFYLSKKIEKSIQSQ